MTDHTIALLELIEKSADHHLVRDLLAYAAERMMDLEVEAKIGATKGERSATRTAQRNGFCVRCSIEVCAGSSWSSRTTMPARERLSGGCCTRHGSAAGFTS